MRTKITVACMLLAASLAVTTTVSAGQKQTAKVVTVKNNKSVKSGKTITVKKGETLKLRVKKGGAIKSVKSSDKKVVKVTNQGKGKKTFSIKGMKQGKKAKVTVAFKSKKFRDFKFTVRVNKTVSSSTSSSDSNSSTEPKIVGTINNFPKDWQDIDDNAFMSKWKTADPKLKVSFNGSDVLELTAKCTESVSVPNTIQLMIKGDTSKILGGFWYVSSSSFSDSEVLDSDYSKFAKIVKNVGLSADGLTSSSTGLITFNPSYFSMPKYDDKMFSVGVGYGYYFINSKGNLESRYAHFEVKVTYNHNFSLKVTPSTCTENGNAAVVCDYCGALYEKHTYNRDRVDSKAYCCSKEGGHGYYSIRRQGYGGLKPNEDKDDDSKQYYDPFDQMVEQWESYYGQSLAEVCARTPHHYEGQTWTVTKQPADGLPKTMSDFGEATVPCSKCGKLITAKLIRVKLSDNRVVYDKDTDTVHSVTREYAKNEYDGYVRNGYHTAADAAYGTYLEDFDSSYERYHCGTAMVYLADFDDSEYTQTCLNNVNAARTARGLGALTLTTDDAKMTYSYLRSAKSFVTNWEFGNILAMYNTPDCLYLIGKEDAEIEKLSFVQNGNDLSSPKIKQLYSDKIRELPDDYYPLQDFMKTSITDVCFNFAASLNTLDSSIMECYDSFITPYDLCYSFYQGYYFTTNSVVSVGNNEMWYYDGSNDDYYISICDDSTDKQTTLQSICPYL